MFELGLLYLTASACVLKWFSLFSILTHFDCIQYFTITQETLVSTSAAELPMAESARQSDDAVPRKTPVQLSSLLSQTLRAIHSMTGRVREYQFHGPQTTGTVNL